jgi:hypothetical protein
MYRDTAPRRASSGGDEKKDWRADLTPPEKVLFDELRSWRNHKCKGDGVAPYIIATNRQKFPKSVRLTVSSRIDNLALDVYEGLIEAQCTKEKKELLRRTNLNLDKLRLLLRLSHDVGYLDHRGFEFLNGRLLKAGRMVGGWRKEQRGR